MKLEINDNVAGICALFIICSFVGFICWYGIKSEESNEPQRTPIVKTLPSKQEVKSLHDYEGSIVIDKKTTNDNKSEDQYYMTIYKRFRYFGWGTEYSGETITIRVTKWEYSLFNCGDEIRF